MDARDCKEAPEWALAAVTVQRRGQAPKTDKLAVEAPLTVQVARRPWITVMRTPGHEQGLIAGLLRAEAIAHEPEEIVDIAACTQLDDPEHDGHVYHVTLAPSAAQRLSHRRRSMLSASSCGLCGKEQIEASLLEFPEPARNEPVPEAWVAGRIATLRGHQDLFDQTGAVHAAAVFGPGADAPWVVREDVGRHNAVDKALGALFWPEAAQLPSARGAWLVVSGRVSFEIVQKAAMHGCAGIIAVSAPTSLAVQLCTAADLCLVGFARGSDFVVYSAGHRIQGFQT